MKKILFVACTHGDELAGFNLFVKYPYGKTNDVEWKTIIGNPDAAFLNTRFLETDLNRSFDADTANSFEEKRAEKLKKILSEYDVVYDMHTTTAIRDNPQWEKCLFVNQLDKKTIAECRYVPSTFVVWDSDPKYQKQYLPAHAKVGITIDYAKTANAQEDFARMEKDFLHIINQEEISKEEQTNQIFTEADRPVTQDERDELNLTLEELKPLTTQQKEQLSLPTKNEYYPIFVNPRSVDATYYCFLNMRVDVD